MDEKKNIPSYAVSWYRLCSQHPQLNAIRSSEDLEAWKSQNPTIALPDDAKELLKSALTYESLPQEASKKLELAEEERKKHEELEQEERRKKEEEKRLHLFRRNSAKSQEESSKKENVENKEAKDTNSSQPDKPEEIEVTYSIPAAPHPPILPPMPRAPEQDTTDAPSQQAPRRQFPGSRPLSRPLSRSKRRNPYNTFSNAKRSLNAAKTAVQVARFATGLSGGTLAWILGGIFIFFVIYILFFGGGGSGFLGGGGEADVLQSPGSGGSGGVVKNPPIPGFTRTIEGPAASNYGSQVTYIITYEYDSSVATVPLEDITLIVKFSSNAQFVEASGNPTSPLIGTVEWALSDSKNVSPLTLTLLPNADNIEIVVNLDQKSTSSASGVGGNACTAPFEGHGPCSVDALAPTFNGDKTKALIASLICQSESTSDPTRIYNNCATKDYSVGLFQINLVAHCAGAYQNQDCNILLSEATRLSCENQLLDSTANIQKMFAISQGTYWKPWTHTWPLAEAKLKSCGIL